MTRDTLAAMLADQTAACESARDALLTGGAFAIWDGLVPANQLAATYRTRLRLTQRRGQSTLALAETIDILEQAGEARVRIGRIDPADEAWTFMLFLDAEAITVLACTGVGRHESERRA